MRFYHNTRCSKSRQALTLLEERSVGVDIIRYIEVGIVEEDLQTLAKLDGIIRKKEAGAEAMRKLQTEADIIELLRMKPIVLERPVLIVNNTAVIGRPPEDILALLEARSH